MKHYHKFKREEDIRREHEAVVYDSIILGVMLLIILAGFVSRWFL